jgi:hypothetical protein
MIQWFAEIGVHLLVIALIFLGSLALVAWGLFGDRSKWLDGGFLTSARAAIEDMPSADRSSHVIETPAGTFPALTINRQISDEAFDVLVDGLVLVRKYVGESESRGT